MSHLASTIRALALAVRRRGQEPGQFLDLAKKIRARLTAAAAAVVEAERYLGTASVPPHAELKALLDRAVVATIHSDGCDVYLATASHDSRLWGLVHEHGGEIATGEDPEQLLKAYLASLGGDP